MMKASAYTAVPTKVDDEVDVKEAPHRFKSKKCLFSVLAVFFFLLLLGCDDESYDHHRHHHMRGHRGRTKLPGGGRDWLVNVNDGTISSKHNTDLVLGKTENPPIVLVKRGSPNQFVFSKVPQDEKDVVPLTLSSPPGKAVGAKTGDIEKLGPYKYMEIGLVPSEKALSVGFIQNNFVRLADKENKKEEFVLDVAFWNIAENTPVTFVADKSKKETYKSGGGRDWVWNADDGTLATKLNPDFVLGSGAPPMVLVKKGSPNQLVFDKAQELADGATVLLTLASGKGAVAKKYKECKEFEEWRFIESAVVSDFENAVSVRFDGNFVLLEDDNMALDVSFWKILEGNTVNFVGAGVEGEDHDGYHYLRSSSSDSSSSSGD